MIMVTLQMSRLIVDSEVPHLYGHVNRTNESPQSDSETPNL